MEDAAVQSSETRPRWRTKLAAAFGLILLSYLASPYYSIWRFGESLRARDMEALAAHVEFEAVRGSLKQQIRDHFVGVLAKKKKDRLAQFLTAAAEDPLGRLIDAYVTPEGLAAMIADPASIKNASSLGTLPGAGSAPPEIHWSMARRAYFTGVRDFAVEHEGAKLRFRFNGFGWKLRALDLQLPPAPSAANDQ